MLEAIHIFTLANILARPIIVLSNRNVFSLNGEALQNDTLGGIYLPLLVNPAEVYKSPILLVYNANHFMPLVSQLSVRNEVPTDLYVPLVRRKLDPLKIHFLLPDQKQDEYSCLKNYLWVKEELQTDGSDYCNKYLVAWLKFIKIDESVDLLHDFVRAVRKWHSDNSPEKPEASSVSKRCSTTGCTYYCAPNSDRFCSLCLVKFQRTDASEPGHTFETDYRNAKESSAVESSQRITPNLLEKHVADLDNYLEPLVTDPSSSTSETPYQRTRVASSHAGEHSEEDHRFWQDAGKSEINLPSESISKYKLPSTDRTGKIYHLLSKFCRVE